jgi:hypothetical protein
MSNLVVGTQTAIQQAGSYGFVQGKGGYTKVKYSVTNSAEVAGLLSQLLAFGYSYDVTPGAEGAYTIVEASKDTNPAGETETTEPLAEIWERDSVSTEKDILQSDLLSVNSILPYRKLLIQKCIDDKTDIDGSLTATEEVAVYNLMAAGVIDPTKVARTAIQNAASVAGLMITTEAMIADKPKDEASAPAMPHGGMGGMGGMGY